MEYVVTTEEMKECDARTIQVHKMEGLVLMERAALGLVKELQKRRTAPARVLVLAGCGNNGGDGLAAGRLLWQEGYEVIFFLAGSREKCSEACKRQLEILESYGISVRMDGEDTGILKRNEYDIIIDALFGIGLSRNLEGRMAEIVQSVNRLTGFKAACDLPSGIQADTGRVMGCAIRADLTVTFAFKKRGLLLYPGAAYAGEVCCVPMGITQDSFPDGTLPAGFTYGTEDLCRLPERKPDGNKGSFGKILVIAGSKNMAGAACLCAKSCYRSGAGLVRIYTPEENRVILQTALPEAVLHTYDGRSEWLLEKKEAVLREDIGWADCIIAGPGIGKAENAGHILEELLQIFGEQKNRKENDKKAGRVCVLDADALNGIAAEEKLRGLLEKAGKGTSDLEFVLTPHLMEFSRLTGIEMDKLKEDIITNAIEYAKAINATIVCKDARTVVAHPDGRIYINTSGNDALATAGSGDVLAGIIGGLSGQGMNGFEAAALGVYLHGLAGEEAAKSSSRYGMMAGDLPDALGRVLGWIS